MITVRLHVDGKGNIWLMARCRKCGNVHKYAAADVSQQPVKCKSCGAEMQLKGAIMEGGDSDSDADVRPSSSDSPNSG
jgi:DNA-directed RNA polymerase subunit M/transcription elongation factor TFIIS